MCTILVISLIIILYICIKWLYDEYKKEMLDIDYVILEDELELHKLERRTKMNEEMINWLWEQVAKEKLKQQKKQNKGKKGDK